VEKEGFKTQTQTGVRIEILQVRSVDFQLELGAVTDRVTVETTAPLLETETSQAGEVIKGEQVVSLPLSARQFLQLAFLTPMAIPATGDFRSTEINRESPMPAAAGQRPEQNNYQIDGVDNRESGRNGLALSASVDAISEFRVQTGLAPAEFGRGGGVIINVATRSGTKRFPRLAVRVCAQRQVRRPSVFLQPGESIEAEPVRRISRRPDPARQASVFRQLRGLSRGSDRQPSGGPGDDGSRAAGNLFQHDRGSS
jgi:hypothetical protein